VRLLLVSHAATGGAGSRDRELTPAARARATVIGQAIPRPRVAFTSPAASARATAEAISVAARPVQALADWDAGGAEDLDDLIERVGDWLTTQAGERGTVAAVSHVAVIRAAVLVALDAPAAAFGSIEVAPCSVTELRARDGAWQLTRVNWEPALLHIPQRRGRRSKPTNRRSST
jgi:broad specificity phosphatase PhoE